MGRDFQINGEALVSVTFGDHIALSGGLQTAELGLASDSIRISPSWQYREIYQNDFGPTTPVELLWRLGIVMIDMSLIHWEYDIAQLCVSEAFGGGQIGPNGNLNAGFAGVSPPGGTLLGNGLPLGASGNHYVQLNIASPQLLKPWYFPAVHLTSNPFNTPLGTATTTLTLNWRNIPYVEPDDSGELLSSGIALWVQTSGVQQFPQ